MKKHFSVFSIVIALMSCSFVTIAEPNRDPVVDVDKAIEFGIWRVYNDGSFIYIVDTGEGLFFKTDYTTNPPSFYTEDQGFFLHSNGSSGLLDPLDPDHPWAQSAQAAISAEFSGHLADGPHVFGSKRFQVDGETMTVFNDFDLGPSGVAEPRTIIKRYSNGLVHTGSTTTTNIDPTVVLDANDIPGPAVTVGDCLATYSPETGRVYMPCLSIEGDNTIYRIELQQAPGGTFKADMDTFFRVQ